ncbi:MBL fold metallo-hydrolase [Actinocrispum sp. NPDC049592]|uniref:MBL fold metallo-hydrolase n=1 Tax=Actinocrispum sp. NPDC049592 TaxID=3154835 RepID=UPI0034281DEB
MKPIVDVSHAEEIAPDLVVIPNRNVQLVPNIGVIGGREAVLVVDTGMGPRNAEMVLAFAREYAKGRRIYVTSTHFHPEHAFGARTFQDEATFLVNRDQAEDLARKGAGYLHMFRGLGEAIAEQLDGVEIPQPDTVYDQALDLDLGGRVVRLRATGRAHSKGDQVIRVDDVLFTGDLVETGQFAIFPWFPPHDTDVSGIRWIEVIRGLAEERPKVVIPGHGDRGGPEVLDDVRGCLELLRDETWARRDSAMGEQTIVEEVTAVLLRRYPEWEGREWIEKGVGCLCAEQ